MSLPSTWRDTVQARAHALEADGFVGPAPERSRIRMLKTVDEILEPFLEELAGDNYLKTLRTDAKYDTPLLPGGRRECLGVLRLALSSYLLGRPIETWADHGGLSVGEMIALTQFFETAPNEDIWDALQYLGVAEGVDDTDPDYFHVAAKYRENWLRFWLKRDEFSQALVKADAPFKLAA